MTQSIKNVFWRNGQQTCDLPHLLEKMVLSLEQCVRDYYSDPKGIELKQLREQYPFRVVADRKAIEKLKSEDEKRGKYSEDATFACEKITELQAKRKPLFACIKGCVDEIVKDATIPAELAVFYAERTIDEVAQDYMPLQRLRSVLVRDDEWTNTMAYIMVKCLDKVHPDTLTRCYTKERINFFDSLGYNDRETGEYVDLGQKMRQMYPNSMIARTPRN